MEWYNIEKEEPPKNTRLILYNYYAKTMWIGKLRKGYRGGGLYGNHGAEPEWEEIGYRADCCGRFTDPTHWAYADINLPQIIKRRDYKFDFEK